MLLALIMLLSVALVGCGSDSDSSDGDVLQISWWIATGEDSTYYDSYDENPAVKYLETMEFNGQKIDLTFSVPVSGAELDNFNTLISVEEYTDIMDMAYSTTSAAELYEDGIIWDLTPYVEEYMPNYMALLNDNPDLAELVYSNVDGEQKILKICSITKETLGNFMGNLYRRDWVAKYGTNPDTGASFTYGFTGEDGVWEDNVLFPSYYGLSYSGDELVYNADTAAFMEQYAVDHPDYDGSAPVTVSDYEWMFRIFEAALDDLGITDGYCISLYYKGYNEDGSRYSSFGSGTPLWYKDADGNAAFGADSDTMRVYLQCMNSWYEQGWLDNAFAEHTSDLVYSIDSAKVHTGKVGMWTGRRSETGTLMDAGDEYTSGIVVYGARQPVNDIYGSEENRYSEPDAMYQYSRVRGGQVITNKVSEEELITVLTFLDYLYTREGGLLLCLGLNADQVAETQDATYAKFGLDYAYTEELQEDGTYVYTRNEETKEDNNLASALAGKRLTVGVYDQGFVAALNSSYTNYAQAAMAEWDYYLNTAYIDNSLSDQFTTDESAMYSKIYANIDTYMATNVPKFISGSLDIDDDQDWSDFCTMVNKYGPEKITAVYDRIFGN